MRSRLLTAMVVGVIVLLACGSAAVADPEWNNITYSNGAQCVAVDGDTVWVGTTGGLVQWSVATGDFVRRLAPEGLPDNSVAAVAVDAEGRVWAGFGTWNGGLAVLDRGAWTSWGFVDGLVTDWVTSLALDGAGRVWIGTVRGVSVLDDAGTPDDKSDDQWTSFGASDGLVSPSVNAICIDGAGRVWCATSSGVFALDTRGTPFDKSDDVWASFTSASGLLADAAYGVSVDGAGRIWFATRGGVSVLDAGIGISDASDDAWISFGAGQSLPASGNAQAVAFHDGTAWISHQKGLVALEGALTPFDRSDDRVTTFTAADGIIKSNVRALAFDGRGTAWCAVPSGGLDRLDGGSTPSDKVDDIWTPYVVGDWLTSAEIRAVDIEGDVTWVASGGGLLAFAGDRFTRFTLGAPLVLQHSDAGVLWMGTTGGLIALGDGGTPFDLSDDVVTYFDTADGLGANYVEGVSLDAAGRVWCATSAGISVLDPNGTPFDKTDDRWASFTTADGLAGDNTNAIAAEGDSRVWIVFESDSVSALDYAGTPFDTSDDTWMSFGEGTPIGTCSGYAVVVDPAGVKWFGLCPGLFALDDGGTLADASDDRWQRFDIGDCNPGLAIDDQGRKWVATGWSGIVMLDDNGTPFDATDDALAAYTTADGLIDDRTQAIAVSGNSIWIGTDGGLSQLNP